MKRVLIVDDEPKICRLLKGFFELRGYHARATTSGHEALTAVDTQPPDFVLLDIRMPDMSGLDVLRYLKSSRPEIAVIMVTAVEDRETAETAMALGARDYIVKPFTFDEPAWARAFFTDL